MKQLVPLRKGETLNVVGVLAGFHPTDSAFAVVLNPDGVAEPD